VEHRSSRPATPLPAHRPDANQAGATLAERLTRLRELAMSLASSDLAPLDGVAAAQAADALRMVTDQLGAVRARLLARVEADGRWSVDGSARSFPEWVARRGGSSVGAARRETALGHLLDEAAPAAGAAVVTGEMSLEHAQVISRHAASSDARRAALASDRPDRNAAFLVDAARRMGVDDFARLVRRWAAAVDTQAHEHEHAAALEREYLRITPRPGGVDLQGFLAAENAETLRTALRAVAGVPAADDVRTPERRRAAALTGLARTVLDHGLGGAGKALVRPHLLVHVPFETFAALAADGEGAVDGTGTMDGAGAAADRVPVLENRDGSLGAPAELDDGTALPLSALARMACDAQITRVVMDPAGQPLDVGRAQRTYTGPQRSAVIARDRTCRYPGCSAPPVLCEVHHITWWSRRGGTSVENGILLCSYHHHLVHRRDISITRASDGAFRFSRAGQAIGVADESPGAPCPSDVLAHAGPPTTSPDRPTTSRQQRTPTQEGTGSAGVPARADARIAQGELGLEECA